MRFSTRAIHVGQEPDPATGAVVVPIYQTSTFVQKSPGKEGDFVYGRTSNPTRTALEKSLASLEEGTHGLAFASGMASVTTVMTLLKAGDHVVAGDDLYGGVPRLFNKVMTNFGIRYTYVDARDPERFEIAMTPQTRMVWIESPTNPLMRLTDIKRAAEIAHSHNAWLVMDSTFASPYLQRPLTLGADIVLHSTTKYLGGHSDLVGGAIVVNSDELYERLKFAQNAVGAVPGPMDCWLVLRGIKTLALRMEQHSRNGQRLAEFLESHPKVSRVSYPGLRSHPQHELAKRQMSGFGGMLSFELKGGAETCKRFLTNLKIMLLAESLGGVESLIEHPASMTHASLSAEERAKIGITDALIRVSAGIEDPEDLVEDFSTALSHV